MDSEITKLRYGCITVMRFLSQLSILSLSVQWFGGLTNDILEGILVTLWAALAVMQAGLYIINARNDTIRLNQIDKRLHGDRTQPHRPRNTEHQEQHGDEK